MLILIMLETIQNAIQNVSAAELQYVAYAIAAMFIFSVVKAAVRKY